jgi:hypothetical protein
VLLYNATRILAEINNAQKAFLLHLQPNWTAYVAAAATRPELVVTAYADGLEYVSCLHSVFYEVKAFLDVYARLLARIICPHGGVPSFGKAKISGCEISGGRLANWIKGLAPEVCPLRGELYDHIVRESREWITPLVHYRDTVAHFRDIPDFRHLRISLSDGTPAIEHTRILPPQMPDGRCLAEYAQELSDRMGKFVDVTIRCIPSVKTELLEPWITARKYLFR